MTAAHVPIVHYNTIGRENKSYVNRPKTEFENDILRTGVNNEAEIRQKPRASSFRINEKIVTVDSPIIICRKLRNELLKGIN